MIRFSTVVEKTSKQIECIIPNICRRRFTLPAINLLTKHIVSSNMPLCTACSGITVASLGSPVLGMGKYQHLSNAKDLIVSAENCPLCSLFKRVLLTPEKYEDFNLQESTLKETLLPEPIILSPNEDPPYEHPDGLYITDLNIKVPVPKHGLNSTTKERKLDVYAEEGIVYVQWLAKISDCV